MGCSSCGTKAGDKPGGCQSNGGCSTGGCNRMNVHDWLMNLPFSDPESSCRVVEISFNQGSRKDYYHNATLQYFEKGELVTVEGVSGFDVGEVSLTGELVRLQLKKHRVPEDSPDMRKIIRRAGQMDIEKWRESKSREKELLIRSRAIARNLGLQMKLAEVELQADGKKATFFYTADDRVDFRELIKQYNSDFKVKVEMRQIGARQEAAKVGGIGSCGRELCCSTWLTDFKSVNTQAARYQNLSINQTKLSGQCGRLKCCLNYELDTYLDALQHFPNNADVLEISRGRAMLVKKDIFRNLMWYTLPDSNKQYPLTIARVLEIKEMNRQGQKPDELQAVEVVSSKPREVEPEFVDVVGQISLRSLLKKQADATGIRSKTGEGNNNSKRAANSNRRGAISSAEGPLNPKGAGKSREVISLHRNSRNRVQDSRGHKEGKSHRRDSRVNGNRRLRKGNAGRRGSNSSAFLQAGPMAEGGAVSRKIRSSLLTGPEKESTGRSNARHKTGMNPENPAAIQNKK
jgi:cell fate regulator YaaT (PSP1 superfamily)